jgi:hypothetical protein
MPSGSPNPRPRPAPEFDHAASILLHSIDTFVQNTDYLSPRSRKLLSVKLQYLRAQVASVLVDYDELPVPA